VATSTATVLCAVLFSSVVALPYNVKHPSSTSKTPDIILKNATVINYLYISNKNLLDHIIPLVYKSVFFFLHGSSPLEGLDLLKDLPLIGSYPAVFLPSREYQYLLVLLHTTKCI